MVITVSHPTFCCVEVGVVVEVGGWTVTIMGIDGDDVYLEENWDWVRMDNGR